MDVFQSAARFLRLAVNGASYTQFMNVDGDIKQADAKWLLDTLLEKRLMEFDSSSLTYWTTIDGIKFLEIQFNMEQILKVNNYVQ